MAQANFGADWEQFLRELDLRLARLLSEFSGGWADLKAQLGQAATALDKFLPGTPETSIASLEELLGTQADELLLSVVTAVERRRPVARMLTAVQDLDTEQKDLLRQLPITIRLSGKERAALSGAARGASGRRFWLKQRGSAREIPLRRMVLSHLQRIAVQRSQAEGALILAATQAKVHLTGPWVLWRRLLLSRLAGSSDDGPELFLADVRWWHSRAAEIAAAGDEALLRVEAAVEASRAEAGTALLRSTRKGRRDSSTPAKRQIHVRYWSRLHRATQALVDIEVEAVQLGRAITRECRDCVFSLQQEHDELLEELDAVRAWLQQWQVNPTGQLFPPPHARLISAGDRTAVWVRNISAAARRTLPAAVETVTPHHPLPNWRVRWQRLEPARVFHAAVQETGGSALLAGLSEVEAGHRGIVRGIEHAREVVAFGMETSRENGAESEAVASEAIANALTLLEYQQRVVPEVAALSDRTSAIAESAVLLHYFSTLERSRFGLLARMVRKRGAKLSDLAAETVQEGVRESARSLQKHAAQAYEEALMRVGLLTPPPAERDAVEFTPGLGDVLQLRARSSDLPAIYRRLFRLAPVEDPRFLIGREREMNGIADALGRWESGEAVAVMVVGARGSGKTSLLNCASIRIFGGVEVLRGQFCQRQTTAEGVRAEICRMLGADERDDPVLVLRQTKRIVVLEEFERVFLRRLGGFDALNAFLDLMHATSGQVLWVVTTNETSYRYLRAAARIGEAFTHRVNAMSVNPDMLTAAILQRHGLSGLQLEFAPVPREDPRVSRARRLLGLERDSGQLFFDSLYRQSEGVYRSAFELWLDSIERVEAGTVYMRQPLAPEYDRLRTEMTLDDCFALQATLQHGSLTPDELAEVMRVSGEVAWRRSKRLQDLQVLEPEPQCPGYRVRPQAGRFVREVLSGRNLL